MESDQLSTLGTRVSRVAHRARIETNVLSHSVHKDLLELIAGKKETWFQPHSEDSEWGYIKKIMHEHEFGKVARLSTSTLGSVLFPPMGAFLYIRFLLGSDKGHRSGSQYAHFNKMDDEEWWYVNGTGVNTDLQMANARQLAHIVKKEVRCYYNPTTGLLVDFIQSGIGLLSYKWKPATKLAKALINHWSLQDINTKSSGSSSDSAGSHTQHTTQSRVILVVHSMGAIIAANAVKYLIKKGYIDNLHRLDIYTFGSPCMEFESVIHPVHKVRVPHYEHFVNNHDYFGSLGAARLGDNYWAVGRVFKREMTGHFFGEHYLPGIASKEYKRIGVNQQSRLYDQVDKARSR